MPDEHEKGSSGTRALTVAKRIAQEVVDWHSRALPAARDERMRFVSVCFFVGVIFVVLGALSGIIVISVLGALGLSYTGGLYVATLVMDPRPKEAGIEHARKGGRDVSFSPFSPLHALFGLSLGNHMEGYVELLDGHAPFQKRLADEFVVNLKSRNAPGADFDSGTLKVEGEARNYWFIRHGRGATLNVRIAE